MAGLCPTLHVSNKIPHKILYNIIAKVSDGDMSEWFKGAVLKTVDGKPSVGSNPTISARFP